MKRNIIINRVTIKLEEKVVVPVAVLKGTEAHVAHNFFKMDLPSTVVQGNWWRLSFRIQLVEVAE